MSVIVTVRENGYETAATSIQCDFGIILYFLLKLIYKCDLSRTTVLEANILDRSWFPRGASITSCIQNCAHKYIQTQGIKTK